MTISRYRGSCLQAVDVFILGGGLGTRIRPVLGDLPKLLAPIAGQPYLQYLFAWLRGFGAIRVVLGLGHGAAAIQDFLQERPSDGIEIETVIEPQPLGTAGAVRFARKTLHTDPVLVLNGDSFVDADLCSFLAHHRDSGASGSIICTRAQGLGRYGHIEVDAAGFIKRFSEKDTFFRGVASINAGVYALSARLLDEIAGGRATSLERDVFERMSPSTLAAYSTRGDFFDIGTPESLADAGRIICERMR
jgi:NDP-sugar pyrophosphorylase family protein